MANANKEVFIVSVIDGSGPANLYAFETADLAEGFAIGLYLQNIAKHGGGVTPNTQYLIEVKASYERWAIIKAGLSYPEMLKVEVKSLPVMNPTYISVELAALINLNLVQVDGVKTGDAVASF